jgi:hypothetical protein
MHDGHETGKAQATKQCPDQKDIYRPRALAASLRREEGDGVDLDYPAAGDDESMIANGRPPTG